MDRQLAPGMEQLVSEDGGGVELPSLFSGIMSAAYKKKSIALEDAERTLNPAIHHPERMQLLYGTATEEEGVAACLRAVLGQLALRKLLKETPDQTWVLGEDFVTDQWLDVLEGEPGDWMRVIVWSQTSDKPSPGMLRDRAREKSRAEIRALASLLEPEKEGLRKINQTIVTHIKRDYAERGIVEDRPEFKILRDQNGRILDGRHRLKAAQDLGVSWPEETIEVHSDEEALRIAVQRNRSHMFDAKLLKSLADKGLTWINKTGKRELVKLELLTDHERADREIARIVGCHHELVAFVRRELEQTGGPDKIRQFTPIDGKRKDEALRVRVRAALEENSKRANNTIGRIVGCSHHLVADVRAEMENEGTVEQYRSTRGRPASTVKKPKEPTVPGRKKIQAPEQKRYGCVYEDEVKAKIADFRFNRGMDKRQVALVYGDDKDHLSLVDRLWLELTYENKVAATPAASAGSAVSTVTALAASAAPAVPQTTLEQPWVSTTADAEQGLPHATAQQTAQQGPQDSIIAAIEAQARALRNAMDQHPECRARVCAILGCDRT